MITGHRFSKGMGVEPTFGWLSFYPNGTSNPDITALEGPLKPYVSSITYSATGGYVITFTTDFTFSNTPQWTVSNHFDTLTNWFEVAIDGAYDTTNRQLTVRAHRSGTGNAVAASANAKITIHLDATNSSGK